MGLSYIYSINSYGHCIILNWFTCFFLDFFFFKYKLGFFFTLVSNKDIFVKLCFDIFFLLRPYNRPGLNCFKNFLGCYGLGKYETGYTRGFYLGYNKTQTRCMPLSKPQVCLNAVQISVIADNIILGMTFFCTAPN